jgi:hypothetical protein
MMMTDRRFVIPEDLLDVRYEAPIQIYIDEMRYEMEDNILKAVQQYGVTVDKDELAKALTYDRQQYDKGYEDGMKHFAEKLKEWFVENSNYWFSHTVNVEIDELLQDELLQTEWK